MKISIVTTMYRSAGYLPEFHERIKASVEQITLDYEIIFVDDGSPDNSLEVAQALLKQNPNVRIIQLSRNFGHHKAMMTGLQEAIGHFIFLIDCDLEEDPEMLQQFWQIMQESRTNTGEKFDLIYGVQKNRKGGWFERVSGQLFFKILNFLSDVPVVPNTITARLMTKRFVKSITSFKEHEPVLHGIDALTGYNRKAIIIEKKDKRSSVYTLSKKTKLAMRFITSLSAQPLIYIFYLGLIVTLISFIMFSYLIIRKFFFGISIAGWTSVMISVWFFGGLLIFCVGLVGLYISIIFSEVKNRPFTIIQDQYPDVNKKLKEANYRENTLQ